MTTSLAARSRAVASAAVLVLVLALGSAAAAAEDPYVPFVTDFPKPSSAQQFVPFVTDFGMEPRLPGNTVVIGPIRPVASPARVPAPAPAPAPEPAGVRSWSDVAVGAALGLAVAGLLAVAIVGVRRFAGWSDDALAEAQRGAGAAR